MVNVTILSKAFSSSSSRSSMDEKLSNILLQKISNSKLLDSHWGSSGRLIQRPSFLAIGMMMFFVVGCPGF